MAYLQSSARFQLALVKEDTIQMSSDTILKSESVISLGEMISDGIEKRRS